MLATSGIQRGFGFAAGALLLLFGLIHFLGSLPSPRESVHVFEHSRGSDAFNTSAGPVRIKKATAIVGQPNHLYEAALKTHERHNEIHGYEMQILRQKIAGNFWAKPSYLLSLIVEELAKPEEERFHWVVWFNPDTIVLNPRVPLELFLPPADQRDIHFIATHDPLGLNSGVLFLRVDQWTVRLLIEVMAVPLRDNRPEVVVSKDQAALEQVLANPAFRGRTVYQPRVWFNAFHANDTFEGQRGSLLIHFPEVNANKWMAMEEYLGNLTTWDNPWEMDVGETAYEGIMADFWGRVVQANMMLKEAEIKLNKYEDVAMRQAMGNLRHAIDYNTDKYDVVIRAMLAMQMAMKERQSE